MLRDLGMPIAIGDDGREPLDLITRFHDLAVRARQIIEMANHILDADVDRKRLQHVTAHETGKVADRLHRDGLQKQIDRLLSGNAEATTKVGAIGRVALVDFGARLFPQTLPERADIPTKRSEVLLYGKRTLRDHIEARRLSVLLPEPEHLGKRRRLAEARVVKPPENNGIGRAGRAQ